MFKSRHKSKNIRVYDLDCKQRDLEYVLCLTEGHKSDFSKDIYASSSS